MSEKSGTLHYTISWDPDLAKENQLVLSHQVMVPDIVRATFSQLSDHGKKRIAFLYLEESGFALGASYMESLVAEYPLQLVASEAFPPQETDFRTLVSRLKLKKPDAYVVWSVMPSIDLLIRQILDQDKGAFVTGYLDYAKDLRKLDEAHYISEMYATPSFAKMYKEKFGTLPISKGPNAYDIFELIVWAYEQFPAKKPQPQAVKERLVQVRNFPGAVGTFSIDTSGNSSYAPVRRTVNP